MTCASRPPSAPCPICRKAVRPDAPHAPFCGSRCRMVDLGRWLQGAYVVPGEPVAALPPEDLEEHLRRWREDGRASSDA